MNQMEIELLTKRMKKPIENWGKIAGTLAELINNYDRLPGNLRELVNGRVVQYLYREIWAEPEKIVFLRDNVVNLTDLMSDRIAATYLSRVTGDATVITTDAALSYIALREHGFRVKVDLIGINGWFDAVRVFAATQIILKPSVLFPILESNMTNSEKIVLLNRMLDERDATLGGLIRGNAEDSKQAKLSELRRKYDELLSSNFDPDSSNDAFSQELIMTYAKLTLIGYQPTVKPPIAINLPSDKVQEKLESLSDWTPMPSVEEIELRLFAPASSKFGQRWIKSGWYWRLSKMIYTGVLEVKFEDGKRYIRYRKDKIQERKGGEG